MDGGFAAGETTVDGVFVGGYYVLAGCYSVEVLVVDCDEVGYWI